MGSRAKLSILYLVDSKVWLSHLYALSTDSDDGSSDDAYDTETELLIEVDGAAAGATNTPREHSQQSTAKLKLLLFKSIFFIGSIVLLVAGGVASQYHPPVDYDNCTQAEAVNQSIVITISDTM